MKNKHTSQPLQRMKFCHLRQHGLTWRASWYHLHVQSKEYNKGVNVIKKKKRNRLSDIEKYS